MQPVKLFILYTGGTIGMGHETPGDTSSPLIPQGWKFLQNAMPAISGEGYFVREKGIEFTYHSFEKVIDSSEFTPSHWEDICRIIYQNYDTYNGFIIIHGTDTMAYTASALSFAFENLTKPVVLTGSQLPIFHPRTDAVNNLSNAIHIAGAEAFSLPVIPEVMICFNDCLLRGNRATKSSSRDFSGFETPALPPLANLEESIKFSGAMKEPGQMQQFSINPRFETNILTVTLFPGFNPSLISRLADDPELKGVILRTFGSGNAPSDASFISAVGLLIRKGKCVLNISQCQDGFVNMAKYKTGSILSELGVISGSDMTLEAAVTKMMWVLANSQPEKISENLAKNLKGELSEI